MRCAVIGAGAWGTALADLLAGNGHETLLWAYEPDVAQTINASGENKRFLSGLSISRAVRATNDYEHAIRGASLVVYATPSHHLRRIARASAEFVERDAILTVAESLDVGAMRPEHKRRDGDANREHRRTNADGQSQEHGKHQTARQ